MLHMGILAHIHATIVHIYFYMISTVRAKTHFSAIAAHILFVFHSVHTHTHLGDY